MKPTSGPNVLHIDLDKCDESSPCAYDNTCRIHKLKGFLENTMILPSSRLRVFKLEPDPAPANAGDHRL